MSRAAAEVGSTANSYQILAKLASGGMADIFLARGKGVADVERYPYRPSRILASVAELIDEV